MWCRVFGRGEGIRTPGPMLPKHVRYQTALHPVRVVPTQATLIIIPETRVFVNTFFQKNFVFFKTVSGKGFAGIHKSEMEDDAAGSQARQNSFILHLLHRLGKGSPVRPVTNSQRFGHPNTTYGVFFNTGTPYFVYFYLGCINWRCGKTDVFFHNPTPNHCSATVCFSFHILWLHPASGFCIHKMWWCAS